MEVFNRLSRVVPDIPDLLLDACTKASISTRDRIIADSRAAIIVHRMKTLIQMNDLVPILEDSPENIQPQQIQFVSVLIDYLHITPQILIKCLKDKSTNGDKSDYKLLCWSAIPAIYGFFSTREHISIAFPFYCMVVASCPQNIAIDVLTPLYISATTYKFIEAVYQKFGPKFCHDIRINTAKLPQKIIDEYIPEIIDAIIKSLPLLPQQHNFLIKYMVAQGWAVADVLHFFIHRFTMPQVIRYLRATPFKHHYDHLVQVAKSINIKSESVQKIMNCFETNSIYEIPPAFTVFDIPFMLLLISRKDIDVIIRSLQAINELPKSMDPFLKYSYFTNITSRPFWMRIYSRKPKPIETSYNWRPVVFEDLPNIQPIKDESLSRLWNKIISDCSEFGIHPLNFLNEEPKDPSQLERLRAYNSATSCFGDKFMNYATTKSLELLKANALSFERYLVHNLALQSLTKWLNVVEDELRMFVIPFSENAIQDTLKEINPKKLIRNPRYIDSVLENAASKVDMAITRQLQYLYLIQHMLPILIGPQTNEEMKRIDLNWKQLIEEVRPNFQLPSCFSNRSKNKEQALLLNGRLWRVITLLNSMPTVKFSAIFFIFMKAMRQLDELETASKSEDAVTQYALVLTECPFILTRFILINAFFVKQDRFRNMSDAETHLVLWCRLETAILKILSHDSNFMSQVLEFQEMLIAAKLL